MKLTILTDNTTLIDRYYVGEPGFCAYLEDGGKKILFDLGYSDVFMRNARRMRLDLSALDYVGISHGHSDHTWGLECLLGESRILDVIGGLHLLNPGEDQMAKTLEYLKGQDLARMHPCHCTDFRSRARLSTVVPVEEVGVGLSLEFS